MLTEQQARDAVIIALDMGEQEALELCERLSGKAVWVKVGMTLYYACGPSIVDKMRAMGYKVFLDLKLHDIPFQIEGAAEAASLVGADILSIHGLGGAAMIAGARAGVERAASSERRGGSRTQLIAISVLTSMDQEALESIGVASSVADEVSRLATLAVGAGSDGLVCSPQEAASMRALLGEDAIIVTPGIRPAGADLGDQRRVSTPAAAIAAGASKLVVGRPITKAADPVQAFEDIVAELMA